MEIEIEVVQKKESGSRQVEPHVSTINDKILLWMATGQVGASSQAMAFAAIDFPNDKSHPYDPSDFNRCLLLLADVPEIRDRFDKIADLSDTWKKLIDRWNEIEQCFIDEVGFNWSDGTSAPKTYELLKTVRC